jgi:hypothetical protein
VPGELIDIANPKFDNGLYLGITSVRDYNNGISYGPVVVLRNGALALSPPYPPHTVDVISVEQGYQFVWTVERSGRAIKWGAPDVDGFVWSNIKQIDVLQSKSIGVTFDGGLIGDGIPNGITNVKKAVWGVTEDGLSDFVIALMNDGSLAQWGTRLIPVPKGMTNIVDLACGYGHVIVVHANGRLSGWGRNDSSQATPPFTTNAVKVFASGTASLAILNSGELLAWGTTQGSLAKVRSFKGVGKFRPPSFLIGDYPAAAPPEILSFDNKQRRRSGALIKLAAEVSGSLPLHFQWFKDGKAIPGAADQVFSIDGAVPSDSGNYSLVISNDFGVAKSSPKMLEVTAEKEPSIDVWVTSDAISGPGSLSDALASASSTELSIGVDVIGDIYWPSEYTISSPRRIAGVSGGYTRIRTPSGGHRFFSVSTGSVLTIENLSFLDGHADRGDYGGAISNAGTLKVFGCTFRQNESTAFGGVSAFGGAIYSSGNLEIDRSIFSNNRCYAPYGVADPSGFSPPLAGGAIMCVGGTARFSDCEFESNAVYAEDSSNGESFSAFGGAVALTNCLATIESSTFLNNSAHGGAGGREGPGPIGGAGGGTWPAGRGGAALGGALFVTNSAIVLRNATLTQNSTDGPGLRALAGAAVYFGGARTSQITFSTIVSNTCLAIDLGQTNGSGIHVDRPATASVSASILFQNLFRNSMSDARNAASGGFNLLSLSNGWVALPTDFFGDPHLSTLTDNGGFTRTMLPDWLSPALDRGPATAAIPVDQRGSSRPSGPATDIGAVEAHYGPPVITSQSESTIVPIGGDITLVVEANGPIPLAVQWFHNNAAIPDATNATLSLMTFSFLDQGAYSAEVSNVYGAISSAPRDLKPLLAPAIVLPLTNQIAAPGQDLIFQVLAAGQKPFQYTWFYNDQIVPGATNSSLAISNVARTEAGVYRARVENALGSNETSAELTFWPVIEVLSLADRGPNTLREAIALANATPQALQREILLRTNGVIPIESTLPQIQHAIQLTGSSAFLNVIDGQMSNTVFDVSSSGRLEVEALTIRHAVAALNQNGGGIRNEGLCSLERCMIISNKTTGGFGGGIANRGTLVMNSCTLAGNSAVGESTGLGGAGAGFGGALFSEGTIFATNVTFSSNQALGGSAGLATDSGRGGGPEGGAPGQEGNRYFGSKSPGTGGFGSGGGRGSGTSYFLDFYPGGGGSGGFGGGGGAGGWGLVGASYSIAGPGGRGGYGAGDAISCHLTNDTRFPEWVATSGGGGGIGGAVFIKNGTAILVNCTIVRNSAAGGKGSVDRYQRCEGAPGSGIAGALFNYQGSVTLKNSIVANNTAATQHDDLEGLLQSNGHNLIKSFAPDSGVLPTDVITGDFSVQPLADNGGDVFTCALTERNPALGSATFEVPFDARGVPRIGIADIGAYQLDRVQINRLTIENGEFALYVDVPAPKAAFLQTAETITGLWQDVLPPLNPGKSLRVSFPVSGHARFVRIKPE